MNKDKEKPLDPKWVNELIDYMIGPFLVVIASKSATDAGNFVRIVRKAVAADYDNNDYENTNAWVVAASARVWDLYNTYMTAKLIKTFDDGVPKKSRIVGAKGRGILVN